MLRIKWKKNAEGIIFVDGSVCFPGASHTGCGFHDCRGGGGGGNSTVRRMFLQGAMDCVLRQ